MAVEVLAMATSVATTSKLGWAGLGMLQEPRLKAIIKMINFFFIAKPPGKKWLFDYYMGKMKETRI
jgi:hypothetical protein